MLADPHSVQACAEAQVERPGGGHPKEGAVLLSCSSRFNSPIVYDRCERIVRVEDQGRPARAAAGARGRADTRGEAGGEHVDHH